MTWRTTNRRETEQQYSDVGNEKRTLSYLDEDFGDKARRNRSADKAGYAVNLTGCLVALFPDQVIEIKRPVTRPIALNIMSFSSISIRMPT